MNRFWLRWLIDESAMLADRLRRRSLQDQLHPAEGYRGLGRSGGRAASARGRMRSRGPIGGGTACNVHPQLGQNSKPALGPERYARSQWPRAEHSWLMHCTVQPGKYCMLLPPVAAADDLRIAKRPKQLQKQQRCRIVKRETSGVKNKAHKIWGTGCRRVDFL